ncbi:UbiA family prenyltransferase [Candidatus Woesearchaeota archaeon]|nr:UbiA family prenyltransferase [Candidatus Woesearchaeota archaeon]
MNAFFYHLRPWQWYKNVLVFLPLFFGGYFFDTSSFLKTLFAFVLLCMLSSGNYMLNDTFDWKRDRYNKEKKRKMSRFALASSGTTLAVLSLFLSTQFFPLLFSGILFLLFILSFFYSFFLKHLLFLDVLLIAVNFVLRAVAGAFVFVKGAQPYIWISPWLIICTFFLALFLALGKRSTELTTQHQRFRPVLQYYTPELTKFLLMTITACLIMSYTLYSFLGEQPEMIFTLPFALYVIFSYLHFIFQNNPLTEKPYLLFQKPSFLSGIFLWIFVSFLILYF